MRTSLSVCRLFVGDFAMDVKVECSDITLARKENRFSGAKFAFLSFLYPSTKVYDRIDTSAIVF